MFWLNLIFSNFVLVEKEGEVEDSKISLRFFNKFIDSYLKIVYDEDKKTALF